MEWELVHEPPTDGGNYYFTPTTQTDLKSVLANAVTAGVTCASKQHDHGKILPDRSRVG